MQIKVSRWEVRMPGSILRPHDEYVPLHLVRGTVPSTALVVDEPAPYLRGMCQGTSRRSTWSEVL
jgi:hypothetical protein